jgi:hypothetical protein
VVHLWSDIQIKEHNSHFLLSQAYQADKLVWSTKSLRVSTPRKKAFSRVLTINSSQ